MEEQDIKRAGLKITQPRVKILDLLSNSPDRHLGAEEIYRTLLGNGEEVGLATVYRVLTQFEAAGLVNRHHFEGGQAVFELATEEHHDHMVCMKTGRVLEFCDPIIEQRRKVCLGFCIYALSEYNPAFYSIIDLRRNLCQV